MAEFIRAPASRPCARGWIAEQWDAARLETGKRGALLVLDEIQKVPG